MIDSMLIPHLVVSDGAAAVAFYEKAFGARLEEKHLAEDGKRFMHAHVSFGKGALYLHDEFPEYGDHDGAKSPTRLGGASCVIHLDVPDADAVWKQAVDAGAEIVMPLADQFWGARYGQVRDPFGHVWSIAGPQK
ncbi:MAG TPA: VOC family protein [Gammaproteobacteria bacterium]